MTGELVDVLGIAAGKSGPRGTVAAWELADAFLDWVRPALDDNGDTERISRGLEQIRIRGTGAELQRESFARDGSIASMLDAVSAVMNHPQD